MKDMNELTGLIKQWAKDTGLSEANSDKQVIKLGEEYGELCEALLKDRKSDFADAIGDMFVVITILAMQEGMDINKCVDMAYNEIKDRVEGGKTINGVFIKEEDLNT